MDRRQFLKMAPVALVVSGCAGLPDIDIELPDQINWDDVATKILVKSTANAIGYFIGKANNAELESLIVSHYTNIQAGKIDLIAINAAISWLASEKVNPLFQILVINFLDAAHAVFINGELKILDVPEHIWKMAKEGYLIGLELGKSQRASKAIV